MLLDKSQKVVDAIFNLSGLTQIVIPAQAGIQRLAIHGRWIPASQPE